MMADMKYVLRTMVINENTGQNEPLDHFLINYGELTNTVYYTKSI